MVWNLLSQERVWSLPGKCTSYTTNGQGGPRDGGPTHRSGGSRIWVSTSARRPILAVPLNLVNYLMLFTAQWATLDSWPRVVLQIRRSQPPESPQDHPRIGPHQPRMLPGPSLDSSSEAAGAPCVAPSNHKRPQVLALLLSEVVVVSIRLALRSMWRLHWLWVWTNHWRCMIPREWSWKSLFRVEQ